jgi:hypothetical protein
VRTLAVLGWSLICASVAAARSVGEPVRLVWDEGDVAGVTSILSPDTRQPIGFVEYRQRREGDVLTTRRLARFRDGSSDEDTASAEVGSELKALRGRSIVRGPGGELLTDVDIDVVHGRIVGQMGSGKSNESYQEDVELAPGTYWGPLLFLVLKNFEPNADGDRVVFRTVVPTPRARVLDMELVRMDRTSVTRLGATLPAEHYRLRPTIHPVIDPVLRLVLPAVDFYVSPGEPPALLRFAGPRNYAGQGILLE